MIDSQVDIETLLKKPSPFILRGMAFLLIKFLRFVVTRVDAFGNISWNPLIVIKAQAKSAVILIELLRFIVTGFVAGYDAFGNISWNLFVVIEAHAKCSATLSH